MFNPQETLSNTNGLPEELNPENLETELSKNSLAKTPNGLIDGIALIGPTQDESWRDEMESILHQDNTLTYDPNVKKGHWQANKHALSEAKASQQMAVVAVRVENAPGVTNGGLGSLVETGMLLFSSQLYGQRVVIGIDSNFEKSLTDPAAIVQYQDLKNELRDAMLKSGGNIEVVENCSRQLLAERARAALRTQRSLESARSSITAEDLAEFDRTRQNRLSIIPHRITFGGSSGAFSNDARTVQRFEAKQNLIHQILGGKDKITILNGFPFNLHWKLIDVMGDDSKWDLLSPEDQALLQREYNFNINNWRLFPAEQRRHQLTDHMAKAFVNEKAGKNDADILVWVIQNEALSLGALVEIGSRLRNALATGQQLIILLEPIDLDQYVRSVFVERIQSLKQQLGNDPLLLELELNPKAVTFEMIQASPNWRGTAEFMKLKTAHRAREIAIAQLDLIQDRIQALTADSGIEIATIANDLGDFIQKLTLFSSTETIQGRTEYFENFRTFRALFENLVQQHSGERDQAVPLIKQALFEAVPAAQSHSASLMSHLEDCQNVTRTFADFLDGATRSDGQTFMSSQDLALFVDFISPGHDLLKLLGTPSQQAQPDHAYLLAEVVNDTFAELGYSSEEVDFIMDTIARHENIYKETSWTNFSRSDNPKERALALFLAIDCLGESFSIEDGKLKMDRDLVKSRLKSLIIRHIDTEQTKLAIIRPEWVKQTVTSLLELFSTWRIDYHLNLAPDIELLIIEVAEQTISEVLIANDKRKQSEKNQPDFNPSKFRTSELMLIRNYFYKLKQNYTSQ